MLCQSPAHPISPLPASSCKAFPVRVGGRQRGPEGGGLPLPACSLGQHGPSNASSLLWPQQLGPIAETLVAVFSASATFYHLLLSSPSPKPSGHIGAERYSPSSGFWQSQLLSSVPTALRLATASCSCCLCFLCLLSQFSTIWLRIVYINFSVRITGWVSVSYLDPDSHKESSALMSFK